VFTASFSCVKWFYLNKNLFLQNRPGRRWRRVFSASVFGVKRFFLKKNLSLPGRPGGRWRRASKEGRSPCQPGFSAILRREDRDLQDRKKSPGGKAERLTSVFVSDDSIGARNLTKPPSRSKTLSALYFRWDPGGFRLRGPGGRPVSERGGDIRSDLFVRNLNPTVLRTFSQTPGQWTRIVPAQPAAI
jgi:hypothetical protein